MQIAEAGYVVASIEYRKVLTGVFPQPLEGEYWVQTEVMKVIIDFLDKNLK